MKENIDNKGSEIISKNEAINIEKRSEIILLKKQKLSYKKNMVIKE